jgi:hypothetical protein
MQLSQRISSGILKWAYFGGIGVLLWFIYFGEKTAIQAIRLLPAGKETQLARYRPCLSLFLVR